MMKNLLLWHWGYNMFQEHYNKLVGKTIKEIKPYLDYDDYYQFFEIVFTDDTSAVILNTLLILK